MIPSPLWGNFTREIWTPEALEILRWNSGEAHPSSVIAAVFGLVRTSAQPLSDHLLVAARGFARALGRAEPKLVAGIPI
jgi:hypothetical protein